MFVRYLLYAFLLYLLYRFIVGFVIPVFITTRQMKKQFREMSGRMENYMNQSAFTETSNDKQTKEPGSTSKKQGGDYCRNRKRNCRKVLLRLRESEEELSERPRSG